MSDNKDKLDQALGLDTPTQENQTEQSTEAPAVEKPEATDVEVEQGFRRMEPTCECADLTKRKTKPRTKAVTKQTTESENGVHTNPALLVFPTDRYGLTAEVKAAILKSVSRIAGDPVKSKLFDDTMRILLQHKKARFKRDSEYRKSLQPAKAE